MRLDPKGSSNLTGAATLSSEASEDFVVALRDVVKDYGSREALRGIDLDIPRGCCFGIFGPNGEERGGHGGARWLYSSFKACD